MFHLYLINDDKKDRKVEHETHEGWLEFDGLNCYQCEYDEDDEQITNKTLILHFSIEDKKWYSNDAKGCFNKFHIVQED
jgi:hypothetical protein